MAVRRKKEAANRGGERCMALFGEHASRTNHYGKKKQYMQVVGVRYGRNGVYVSICYRCAAVYARWQCVSAKSVQDPQVAAGSEEQKGMRGRGSRAGIERQAQARGKNQQPTE